MPNCFQLCRIGGDGKAIPLSVIDSELWRHFEGSEPENNTKWYRYWYDTIGLQLAMGRSWHEIKEDLSPDSKMGPLVDYLSENFSARSWYEHS